MSIKVQSYVWENSRMKGSALLLLLAIADHSHDDGTGAWPSVESLSKKCRQSERNTQRLLRVLEKTGEIVTKIGAGPNGCNAYQIPLKTGDKMSPVTTGVQGGDNWGTKTPQKVPQLSPEPSYKPSITINSDFSGKKSLEFPGKDLIPPSRKMTFEQQIEQLDKPEKKVWQFETPLALRLQRESKRGPVKILGFSSKRQKEQWEKMETEMPEALVVDKIVWACRAAMPHKKLIQNVITAVYRTRPVHHDPLIIGEVRN